MSSRTLLALCAMVSVALGGAVVPAAQAADFEWKFYTFFGANDLPAQPARGLAEAITKASNGRLKLSFYTAGELPYKFNEVLRAVSTNQVQMGELGMGLNAGELPGLNPFDLPFLCTSIDQWKDGVKAVAPLIEDTLQQKFGLTSLLHWAMPPQQIWLNSPLKTIDDLKGRKIRNWNRIHVDMLSAFGASATTVTSAEVATALDRRVVDGAITATIPAYDWKFYEVAKWGYMLNFQIPHQIVIVNTAEFNKLPKDLQDVVRTTSQQWQAKYLETIVNGDLDARKKLKEKGEVLIEPSKEDVAKARTATRAIWEKWAKETAPAGEKAYKMVADVCLK